MRPGEHTEGFGAANIDTPVTTPKVPSDPMNSCFKSYPVLSLRSDDIRSSTFPFGSTWCTGHENASVAVHVQFVHTQFPLHKHGVDSSPRRELSTAPRYIPLLTQSHCPAESRIADIESLRHWSTRFRRSDSCNRLTQPWHSQGQ